MMKYVPNKIAVIIPTYNAAETIERAIRSVQAQQLPHGIDLEIVVVDDCSSDVTYELVSRLAASEPRLSLFRQAENGGPSAARNRALQETDAGWFTPLDSDDFMLPERLNTLFEAAQRGNWQLVADNLLISEADAPNEATRKLWPEKPKGVVKLSLPFFIRHNLEAENERCELGYIKPLIDRRTLTHTAELYRSEMRFGEDYDLYARLIAGGLQACLIDEAGYFAVQRQGSLSRTPSARDFSLLIKTDDELLNLNSLSDRARNEISRHRAETMNEWVWVRAIEAVRKKQPLSFLSCFFVSPASSWALVQKLRAHFFSGAISKQGSPV